jgi:hypothetical protein
LVFASKGKARLALQVGLQREDNCGKSGTGRSGKATHFRLYLGVDGPTPEFGAPASAESLLTANRVDSLS